MTQEVEKTFGQPLAPERAELIGSGEDQILDQLTAMVKGFTDQEDLDLGPEGSQFLPGVLVQRDAFSDAEEAVRDEFVRRLSESLGIDVEEGLNTSDHQRIEADQTRVALAPWMKDALSITFEPDETTEHKGVLRETELAHNDETSVWMHEVEVTVRRGVGGYKHRDFGGRVMYFTAQAVATAEEV